MCKAIGEQRHRAEGQAGDNFDNHGGERDDDDELSAPFGGFAAMQTEAMTVLPGVEASGGMGVYRRNSR